MLLWCLGGLISPRKDTEYTEYDVLTVALFAGAGRGSARLVASRGIVFREGEACGAAWDSVGLGGVRLSRSFALPRGEACGAARDSLGWEVFGSPGASPSQGGRGLACGAGFGGLGGVRLSGSFALPKGAAGLAECAGDDFPAFGDTGQSFLSSEVFEVEVIGLQSEGGEECGVEVFDGLG